ncbi:MAG: (Fe-S)-binding protein [Polyangiaceae bacterium]|nr:(Fe-S)-binding protein [Polyangiaceae bacterium]
MPGPALPLLDAHRHSLETCVYCPKLCRTACPVSNAEASETVTPWGKMSTAYFSGRGDLPLDANYASTAWACSGCFACRSFCEHQNPVATVLMDARAEAYARGVAPEQARKAVANWHARAPEITNSVNVVATQTDTDRAPETSVALLIGCGYARRFPDVALDAARTTMAFVGSKTRPVRACCGLPLLHAGDHDGFVRAARRFAAEVSRAPSLVVVDPGCARTLLQEYPRVGVALPPVNVWIDLAARERMRLRPLEADELTGERATEPAPSSPPSNRAARVRFHDPCQLGRGLGKFDEPRSVLERVAGNIAGFTRDRDAGECSGGGGLLPVTRPETSLAIAQERIAEHKRLGGGVLITHCASSLHRFRSAGTPAVDLITLVARALSPRNSA